MRSPGEMERRVAGEFSRRRFLEAAAALSASGVLLSACGGDDGGSGGGDQTIGVNLPFTENDPWLPLMEGAEQEAEKREYQLLKTASNLEVERQLTELNTWIAQGVAALTIFPLDPTALRPAVERAIEADIKVVAYASSVPGAEGSVLFNDKKGSRDLADAAVAYANEHFQGQPKVALITQDDAEVSRIRKEAMVARLQERLPDAEVVAEAEGRTPPQGLKAAQTILESQPEVNMFLAHNDPPLAGVAQALSSAGRAPEETWLGGLDGAKIWLEKLANGDAVGASAALDLIAIGRRTVSVAANLVEGTGETEYLAEYVIASNDTPKLLDKLLAQYDV